MLYAWSFGALCLFVSSHRTETLFHTISTLSQPYNKGGLACRGRGHLCLLVDHLLLLISGFLSSHHSLPYSDVNEKAFGNVRSLFDEDLPLPKDWMAKENAPSKTFGASGGNHHHPVHGSYPFHGKPGGHDGHGQPGYPAKPNPGPYPAGNTRVLFAAQDLPLPKDWMVAASKDSTYGGEENGGGGHHDHGSYPYGGGAGGQDGGDHTDGEDPSYGNPGDGDNAYPAYNGDHPDKMAAVPGSVAYLPKTPVVRSLETVMFKKSQDDQEIPFYLRGRRPST